MADQETRGRWKAHGGKLLVCGLILTFFVLYLFESIFITIYPGHAGVLFHRLWNRGTDLRHVYGEGLNMIFPWDEMFVYDARIQKIHQTVNVLSQNGLTIEVFVSVRFHLLKKRLPELHQKVGPAYLEKIIIPSTISSVREVVGNYRPEELYTTARHRIQDEVLIEAVESTGRLPIVYDEMIIENIKLPELINNAIETKLKQQQAFLEYEFRIQKEEAEILRKKREAEGIREYQRMVNETITQEYLRWKGIEATLALAASPNAKVVVVGGKDGLPLILNPDGGLSAPLPAPVADSRGSAETKRVDPNRPTTESIFRQE